MMAPTIETRSRWAVVEEHLQRIRHVPTVVLRQNYSDLHRGPAPALRQVLMTDTAWWLFQRTQPAARA